MTVIVSSVVHVSGGFAFPRRIRCDLSYLALRTLVGEWNLRLPAVGYSAGSREVLRADGSWSLAFSPAFSAACLPLRNRVATYRWAARASTERLE